MWQGKRLLDELKLPRVSVYDFYQGIIWLCCCPEEWIGWHWNARILICLPLLCWQRPVSPSWRTRASPWRGSSWAGFTATPCSPTGTGTSWGTSKSALSLYSCHLVERSDSNLRMVVADLAYPDRTGIGQETILIPLSRVFWGYFEAILSSQQLSIMWLDIVVLRTLLLIMGLESI